MVALGCNGCSSISIVLVAAALGCKGCSSCSIVVVVAQVAMVLVVVVIGCNCFSGSNRLQWLSW